MKHPDIIDQMTLEEKCFHAFFISSMQSGFYADDDPVYNTFFVAAQ